MAVLLVLVGIEAEARADTNAAPDFMEVYDLVRAHVRDLGVTELNRAAVQALVTALGPKVSLVANGEAANATGGPMVSKSSLFDRDIGYVRIARVGEGLAKALRAACDQLGPTNKLKGLVLDLRFAGGDDYAAAVAAADLFVNKERPLLDWGNGLVRSKEKADAITVPVAVLVNRRTAGAAEALAAVLRQTGAGLVLGSKTAGQAMIAQEFPLKDGQRLRIATAPIQLGDGSALSGKGLKPDITVEVSLEEEQAYYSDAFKAVTKPALFAGVGLSLTNPDNGTNRFARRPRFNEAELVRERRDGPSRDSELTAEEDNGPERTPVRDPALARALDLLKGLAVVRHSRP